MRAILIALLLCAVNSGVASAQSTYMYRGVFSFVSKSDECVGQVPVGESGLIRFSAASDGSKSAFSLYQPTTAQSFVLGTGIFDETFRPVETMIAQARFVQPANEVSVRLTRQVPKAIQQNAYFFWFAGWIRGYDGNDDCVVRIRAALTKNID